MGYVDSGWLFLVRCGVWPISTAAPRPDALAEGTHSPPHVPFSAKVSLFCCFFSSKFHEAARCVRNLPLSVPGTHLRWRQLGGTPYKRGRWVALHAAFHLSSNHDVH